MKPNLNWLLIKSTLSLLVINCDLIYFECGLKTVQIDYCKDCKFSTKPLCLMTHHLPWNNSCCNLSVPYQITFKQSWAEDICMLWDVILIWPSTGNRRYTLLIVFLFTWNSHHVSSAPLGVSQGCKGPLNTDYSFN